MLIYNQARRAQFVWSGIKCALARIWPGHYVAKQKTEVEEVFALCNHWLRAENGPNVDLGAVS